MKNSRVASAALLGSLLQFVFLMVLTMRCIATPRQVSFAFVLPVAIAAFELLRKRCRFALFAAIFSLCATLTVVIHIVDAMRPVDETELRVRKLQCDHL